jgi:hypothetical protein
VTVLADDGDALPGRVLGEAGVQARQHIVTVGHHLILSKREEEDRIELESNHNGLDVESNLSNSGK